MNNKNLLWSLLIILFASIFSVTLVSCGNDDDDNPNESTITENDPEGTILMNLVNNDDDICIDEEWPYMYVGMTPQNNIDTWYQSAQIVSVGKVNGLSAIKKYQRVVGQKDVLLHQEVDML